MPTETDLLRLRTLTLAMALATFRRKRPALVRSDRGHEGGGGGEAENTYDLPTGTGLAAELRAWFERQQKAVLDAIPKGPLAPIPASIPALTDWDDPMARAFVPYLSAEWDASGKATAGRLGLDPETFHVQSPHLREKIESAALNLSASTNATTSKRLDTALAELRASLAEGLAGEGETAGLLTARVKAVFTEATEGRAARIAATEASRAYHAAQEQADLDSGVVAGLELLLSGDACPLCRKIATEARRVPLGQPFAVIGNNPAYSEIRYPPLHPRCACSIIEVLKPEYGGPPHPEWSPTLHQPNPGPSYTPPAGKRVPEPEPRRARERPRVKTRETPLVPSPGLGTSPAPAPVSPPPAAPARPPVVDRSLAYAASKGVDVRLDGRDHLRRNGYTDAQAANIPAVYSSRNRAVFLNLSMSYWKDPRAFMARAAASQWFSAAGEDHIIIHEVGHALHHRSAGETRYQEIRKARLTPEEADLVAREVSRYGATKPVEFVAETFAGLVSGKTYPPEILNLYRKFGGPEP